MINIIVIPAGNCVKDSKIPCAEAIAFGFAAQAKPVTKKGPAAMPTQ